MSKKVIQVFSIDSGVPIPEDSKRVPLRSMEVGDSILFPLSRRPSIQSLAARAKRLEGMEYTIKKVDERNARIWRTK